MLEWVRRTRAIWALIAALALAFGAVPANAQTTDSDFLEGLRQRRLFELAESYARDRLARLQPGDAGEAELTIELIRTLALHAANAAPAQREPLWAPARVVAADFLRRASPHPRAILVRMQDALTLLAQGELGRQELEAGALLADQLEPTRQALREATDLLEALDKQLTREIPLRHRTPPRGGELSADELLALHRHVEHQLARAQRNRALLFDRGSDDRLALLLAANETLQRPLVKLPPDDPLAASVRLDLIECQRLLGRFEQARELAAVLDQDGVEAGARLRARAETIRTAVAQGNYEAAQQAIGQGRSLEGRSSPELDFAWFEAFLALARAASDGTLTRRAGEGVRQSSEELAKQYQEQAAQTAKFLDENYGPYWGRRADQFLVAALPRGAAGGANVELLSRTADSLLTKGDLDGALKAYDEASSAARAATDLGTAFELAYKAALVEQRRARHGEAATRLRILARTFGTHEQASMAHLLAAWNAAQHARSQPGAAETYLEILREHLAAWPTADSADQARMWLGKLLEARGDLPTAIEAYSGVSRASTHYPAAIAALAAVWREHLAKLAATQEPTSHAADQAVRFFQQAIVGPEDRLPERWTEADRAAALAAAELTLAYRPADVALAEGILRTALEHADDASETWRAAAQAQLVVAIAAQPGRHDEALQQVREIAGASPAQMLAVLEGLASVASRSPDRTRGEIARVQLAAADLLTASRVQLASGDALALDRLRAQALAAAGRADEALALYQRLVREQAGSGTIQEGYADLLLASSEPAHRKLALDQWRIVASRSPPRTPRWYKAKYSVALAQFQLGDATEAATLLRYLLETPPGLSGSGWEEAYRELLGRCER
jgi:hypothetical protein